MRMQCTFYHISGARYAPLAELHRSLFTISPSWCRISSKGCVKLSSRTSMSAPTVTVVSQALLPSDGELPPVAAEKSFVVGCGGAGVDYLATVASYPEPDAKIRSKRLEIQGGGNVGNALTAAARLGLSPRIVTKVSGDAMGQQILAELEGDGIDTSHVIVTPEGTSPFTYIIVDEETKTRTCIHTPGYPPLRSDEMSDEGIVAALDGCHLAYFDVRLTEVALRVAARAVQEGLLILVDAERPREGLDDLLAVADYVVCSSHFPNLWSGERRLGRALLLLLHRLPQLRFVVVTLGSLGYAMVERAGGSRGVGEAQDIDTLLETLRGRVGDVDPRPAVMTSEVTLLQSGGEDELAVFGRLVVGSAAPVGEVVDTTGAGDAFIGAILYGLSAQLSVENMLRLAATVAAAKCEMLGARPGLPRRCDKRFEGLLRPPWIETPV